MGRNTIRRSNGIQPQRVVRLVMGVVVVTVFSMVFVYLQIRNIKLADEVKKLEVSLNELDRRNGVLRVDVDRQMKPRMLQRRMQDLNLQLVSVAELPKVEARISYYSGGYQALAQKEER